MTRTGSQKPTRLRRRHLLVAAAATGAMYGTGAVFAAQQAAGSPGIWAPLSDVAVLGFAMSLAPVVDASARDLASAGAPRTRSLRRTGLVAIGLVTTGSALLLAKDAGLSLAGPTGGAGLAVQFVGLAAMGAWLGQLGVRTLRWTDGARVPGLAAVVAGVGYLGGTAAAALQLFGHPLFAVAYALAASGFVTWLISMIRRTR